MNDKSPYNYLTPIYIEWAMIGIMLGIYIYIPETPYWCANHGEHERGRAIVERLNGRIDGYDVDFHYDLIRKTVEKEKSFQKQIDGDSNGFLQELANVKEVFVGINGVCNLSCQANPSSERSLHSGRHACNRLAGSPYCLATPRTLRKPPASPIHFCFLCFSPSLHWLQQS